MEDLLSLKWNNHQSTFINAFGILRDKQLYTDITLACEGKFYSVHKIVLSTCSDYFSAILSQTNCKNPVIILKDINSEDLEYLLDYMYLGEVNVPQSNLTTLLKAAECLHLKGLAVPDDDPSMERLSSCDTHSKKRHDSVSCSGHSSDSDVCPSPKRSKKKSDPPPQAEKLPEIVRPNSSPPETSLYPHNFLTSNNISSFNQKNGNPFRYSKSLDEDIRGCSSGSSSQVLEDRVKMECNNGSVDQRDSSSYDLPDNELFKRESNLNYEVNSDHGDQDGDRAHRDLTHKSLPALLQHTTDALTAAHFRTPSLSDLQAFARSEASNWPPDSSSLSLPLDFRSLEGSSHQNSTGVRLRQLLSISSALPNLNSTSKIGSPLGTVSCTICHKLFTGPNRRQVLRRHLIIHTGERPYSCHLCQYRANQKSNLNVHILTYHGKDHVPGRCS